MNNTVIMLETERLILRPFDKSDAEAMFRNWASDPDVVRFMPYDVCNTLEDTLKRIDEWMPYFEKTAPNSAVFAIELKTGGEIIGTIDFAETDREAKAAEVGYQLGKSWWGCGYAAEALQAVIKYYFETVGLNRVWASYDPRNPNSGKVLCKAGMIYEGTLRQCKVRRGELADSVRYAILADDYFQTEKKNGIFNTAIFWQALDKLVSTSKIIIDRPKGSRHPKYPDCIYPVDYGYLVGTSSMDGGGIDVWKGTNGDYIDAIICTVDLLKRDSEIKILIGCNEEEKQLVIPYNEYMKGILIRRK